MEEADVLFLQLVTWCQQRQQFQSQPFWEEETECVKITKHKLASLCRYLIIILETFMKNIFKKIYLFNMLKCWYHWHTISFILSPLVDV
jgi:hypothetical protein